MKFIGLPISLDAAKPAPEENRIDQRDTTYGLNHKLLIFHILINLNFLKLLFL